ncbi:hypothetical protein ACFLZC_01060 [Patescibacteria group bacterium]
MEEELFKKLKELNLPLGKYAVFGSGSMCAHGLRDCNDIDLLVTKDLFEEYKLKEGWSVKKLKSGLVVHSRKTRLHFPRIERVLGSVGSPTSHRRGLYK